MSDPRLRRAIASALDVLSATLGHLAARVAIPEWCLEIRADGTEHFYPLLDAINHDPDETCVCGPTWELDHDDDGDNWTLKHHPLTQKDVPTP